MEGHIIASQGADHPDLGTHRSCPDDEDPAYVLYARLSHLLPPLDFGSRFSRKAHVPSASPREEDHSRRGDPTPCPSSPPPPSATPYPLSSQATSCLAGRHPDRPVQTNNLAVEHLVFDDMPDERGVLFGSSQTRRERCLLAEGLPNLLRQCRCHRCLEETGGYGHHPDAMLRELP